MAQQIILRLTEKECERFYTIIEGMAQCRPLLLNVIKAMRAMSPDDHLTLRLKRDTADQILKVLRELDPGFSVRINTIRAIQAAGGIVDPGLL